MFSKRGRVLSCFPGQKESRGIFQEGKSLVLFSRRGRVLFFPRRGKVLCYFPDGKGSHVVSQERKGPMLFPRRGRVPCCFPGGEGPVPAQLALAVGCALESLGSGTQPCAPPSWEEFRDPSICDRAGDEPFPHPNPDFPAGKSSHRVWVCFATVGSLKLGSGLLSGRGFCSFLAPGEVLKIPQHFREKTLLFPPVLIVWAGGE